MLESGAVSDGHRSTRALVKLMLRGKLAELAISRNHGPCSWASSMSICLYIKHASEIDQARYRRDGVALPDIQGGDGAGEKFSLAELESIERSIAAREAAGLVDPRLADAHRALKSRVAKGLALARGSVGAMTRPPPAVLDLHKSWHILHYALTGRAEGGALPAATLLSGGTEIGRDLGYGRARIVAASATSAFATYLAGIDVTALTSRLVPAAMRAQGIYGASRGRASLHNDLTHDFPRLGDHVTAAASSRSGLLIWMM